ncbi:hypothetical protein Bca52824_038931 [Brassica carinata]|uniref:BIRD-IDD transcription factor fourth C2HC zinc finger domain-containing protein n=1 Tax=Brassica carinata TaxID=52824 RepID=A0A8X7UVD4_BRACI|nr:hypothetical protein Bca52824_038931 [Brassica carinata]
MLYHHQQQQVEENMSNLTSASGDRASVSSGNRTETSGSNFHYNTNPNQQQEEQCLAPQPSQRRRETNPAIQSKVICKEEDKMWRDSFITHRAFCDALAEESARAIPNPILIPSSSPHQTQHNINFSSSSQNITSHNNNPHGHDELPMKQEEPHHHFHNIPPWLISSNPNPNGNNANYFPLASSSASFLHSSPAMSATALLQKVAQMGPTKSTATPEEEEVEL